VEELLVKFNGLRVHLRDRNSWTVIRQDLLTISADQSDHQLYSLAKNSEAEL